ncbi:MAG: hypothetical protein N2595_05855 [bacterium]|nr:hypothetical protein [bacterium]
MNIKEARRMFASRTSEKDVERAVVSLLRWHGWLVVKIPNDALYLRRVAHAVVGATDLVAVSPRGTVVWIEVKRPGGKPRRTQRAFHEALRERFQRVWVIDNIDTLIKNLEDKFL